MVNIVEIDGKRYQVDVGFGSSGPTHPVLLNKDEPTSLVNVGKQEIRLIYEAISDGTHREKNWWIYQFRHTPELPWVRAYCFDDQIEFLPDDFRVMNIGTSTGTGLFTMNVLCMKMLMEEGKIVGDCTLFGAQVKKRINGVPGTPEVCTNEEERVTAFKNWLQVTFTDEEMKAIKGWKTELKPGSPCRNER
jgi:arylamine N-acetyltransferase